MWEQDVPAPTFLTPPSHAAPNRAKPHRTLPYLRDRDLGVWEQANLLPLPYLTSPHHAVPDRARPRLASPHHSLRLECLFDHPLHVFLGQR